MSQHGNMRSSAIPLAIVGLLLGFTPEFVHGQVLDQTIVYTHVPQGTGFKPALSRVDRRLRVLGVTPLAAEGAVVLESLAQPMSTHGSGEYSIPLDALFNEKILRVGRTGVVTGWTPLEFNPVGTAARADGSLLVLTRIPLLPPGAMYGLAPLGSVSWSEWAPVAAYQTGIFPNNVVVTTSGEVWVAGEGTAHCGCFWWHPILTRIDPLDGSVLGVLELDGLPNADVAVSNFVASPDGSMWGSMGYPENFVNTDGRRVLNQFAILGGSNGATNALWLDGRGDLLTVSALNDGSFGGSILRIRATDGTVFATHPLGGLIGSFAMTNSEDLIAVTAHGGSPNVRKLVRLNLISGVRSSVPVDPPHSETSIPMGDPTGWTFANVVDRQGDNDSDGAPNGIETQTGSNPFDAESVPWGPRTYLSFTPENAIVLKYVDSDGVLDPFGGLDLSSFSLVAEHPSFGSGDIFWPLAGFVSDVSFSPDGTAVTITFGGVPLASHMQVELTASVRDRTGNRGWDWQITPPGDK